ncbi:MAG: hypothetical protein CM15mP83_6880 [Flavobacteriaceae bacterium]|nr:MAG: hypothetical protein CM15mP83_6880 [Flavobacteriaceae bacterium]
MKLKHIFGKVKKDIESGGYININLKVIRKNRNFNLGDKSDDLTHLK